MSEGYRRSFGKDEVHGTSTTYSEGCRCEPCVDGNRARKAVYRKASREPQTESARSSPADAGTEVEVGYEREAK